MCVCVRVRVGVRLWVSGWARAAMSIKRAPRGAVGCMHVCVTERVRVRITCGAEPGPHEAVFAVQVKVGMAHSKHLRAKANG